MNWDFIYRGETVSLDDATRKTATSGSFIKLSDGVTHYELVGDPKGLPVLLIHGFSVPYFIWDPTFQGLASSGFCVLRYDLFGRGFSDRPQLRYDIDLFARQAHELLERLEIRKVDVIGLSMGGAIASAFTVQYPRMVNRLVLIDPVGVLPMPLNLLYKAAILPGISEIILGLFGSEKMVAGLASDFYDPAHVKLFQDNYRFQMQIKGFKRSILSTLRCRTVNGFPNIYESLGKLDTQIMLLWGRNDQTIPLNQSEALLKFISPVNFHIIEDSGHIPHFERPEIVNPLIIDFLRQK
jgi:pimeloyl-ACP methyl ester carboxylesterase